MNVARTHLMFVLSRLLRDQPVDRHETSHLLARTDCCGRLVCLACDDVRRFEGQIVHTTRLPWISWSPLCSEAVA